MITGIGPVCFHVLDTDQAREFYVERFYGVDAAFRDPFGNHWRLTQRKPLTMSDPGHTAG